MSIYVYLAAALIFASIVGGAYWKGDQHGAHSRDKEVAELTVKIAALESAEKANADTLDRCVSANTQLADARAADKQAADAAVVSVVQQRDKLAESLRAAHSQREVVYANDKPSGDWADAALPDRIVDLLRDSAAGGPNADGRGQSTIVREDPAGPDGAGVEARAASLWLEEQRPDRLREGVRVGAESG